MAEPAKPFEAGPTAATSLPIVFPAAGAPKAPANLFGGFTSPQLVSPVVSTTPLFGSSGDTNSNFLNSAFTMKPVAQAPAFFATGSNVSASFPTPSSKPSAPSQPKADGDNSSAKAPARPNTLRTSQMTLTSNLSPEPSASLLPVPKPAPKEIPKSASEPQPMAAVAKPKGHPTFSARASINKWHLAINNSIQQALMLQQLLLSKESRLRANHNEMEELRKNVQDIKQTTSTVEAALEKSWKDLCSLEGQLRKLEVSCINQGQERYSEQRVEMQSAAEDLIGELNVMINESTLVASKVWVTAQHGPEERIQEVLEGHEQDLATLKDEIAAIETTIEQTPMLLLQQQQQQQLLLQPTPSPSPQLLRARSTPYSRTSSHSQRGTSMSTRSFGE